MKTGGPAFPRDAKWNIDGSRRQDGSQGMTLRAWLAGIAQGGILTARDERGRCGFTELTVEEIAAHACEQADAMIAELAKEAK
jgi:hypothetical protein